MSAERVSLLSSDYLGQSHTAAGLTSSSSAVNASGAAAAVDLPVRLDDADDGGDNHSDTSFVPSIADGRYAVLHGAAASQQPQKYRKRARRSRRAQRTQKRAEGLPLLHPDADVSDSDEAEEDTRYRVAAYCTCDTYPLSQIYHLIADRAHIQQPNSLSAAAAVSAAGRVAILMSAAAAAPAGTGTGTGAVPDGYYQAGSLPSQLAIGRGTPGAMSTLSFGASGGLFAPAGPLAATAASASGGAATEDELLLYRDPDADAAAGATGAVSAVPAAPVGGLASVLRDRRAAVPAAAAAGSPAAAAGPLSAIARLPAPVLGAGAGAAAGAGTQHFKAKPSNSFSAAAAAAAAADTGAGAGGGALVSTSSEVGADAFPTTLQALLDISRVSLAFFGTDVLQIKIRTDRWLMQKHAFVFDYGCVAFFNFSPQEERELLAMLRPYEEDTLSQRERESGCENMEYAYGAHSHVSNDTVTLSGDASLEKLSVAFAMAQCVKLNVFEERIDQEIENSKELPEALAATGSIGLTRQQMAKKIGKLFIERNNVNLHADILDDPEFFWEQDRYKHVYEKLFKYLELGKRVGLLNKRLGIMKELFDMIADQLEVAHGEKLEYIIIYLIVVEVVVMVGWQILIKDVLGFFPHGEH
jgi:uncharacterized Rmd1/YagE family protein